MVKVRFAPSPTGYLHIGGARTALFNWLLARQAGGEGKFVLRIEDTDKSRHVNDSLPKILEDLRWLGLDWDEGAEVGGDAGPYFQSERGEIYERYFQQLLDCGQAYYAFDTQEELAVRREKARAEKKDYRYQRPDPLPTAADAEKAKADGKPVVVRFKMPAEDIPFFDSILGPVVISRSEAEDFIIRKADGGPTYHFAVVVDDALMGITHILRGQEHLVNTAKHIALQCALGFRTQDFSARMAAPINETELDPDDMRWYHLPIIFNMDGSKMSKRDKEKALKAGLAPPEIDVHDFRLAGYLPEAVLNYICLLGWSPGDDREKLTIDEMIKLFSAGRIGKTSAKFDRDKLLAFNTDEAAGANPDRLLECFKDYLSLSDSPMRSADDALLAQVLQACAGFRTFPDVEKKAGFLFVADEAIEFDPNAVKKVFAKNDGEGYKMLDRLLPELESADDWTDPALDALLKKCCEEWSIGMGKVAQPIRVAVSGSTISPSIGQTLVLLGKEATMKRIRSAIERAGSSAEAK